MEPPTVRFAIPCYGGNIMAKCFHSFLNFIPYADENGINYEVQTLRNCSLISLGRTMMVTAALKEKEWTHLFWLDADVYWEPKHVHYLLAADKDIVTGFYPAKSLPLKSASGPDKIKKWLIDQYPNLNPRERIPEKLLKEQIKEEGDFVESRFLTTGFMCIKRHVLEKMVEHYTDLNMSYQGETHCHIFETMIDKDRDNMFLGEDYSFVKRANDIGFKSYLASKVSLGHIGTYEYSEKNEEKLKEIYKRENESVI
tara:strand:+ start:5643 stop:6407 length:765 start_codon:yes stop_codon:yes gene_type:complete